MLHVRAYKVVIAHSLCQIDKCDDVFGMQPVIKILRRFLEARRLFSEKTKKRKIVNHTDAARGLFCLCHCNGPRGPESPAWAQSYRIVCRALDGKAASCIARATQHRFRITNPVKKSCTPYTSASQLTQQGDSPWGVPDNDQFSPLWTHVVTERSVELGHVLQTINLHEHSQRQARGVELRFFKRLLLNQTQGIGGSLRLDFIPSLGHRSALLDREQIGHSGSYYSVFSGSQ